MIQFKNPQFEDIKRQEWLVTNGLGGYASSSVSQANTRRYHGLLVATFNPPTDRRVLVSKIEETLIVEGKRSSFRRINMVNTSIRKGMAISPLLTDCRYQNGRIKWISTAS